VEIVDEALNRSLREGRKGVKLEVNLSQDKVEVVAIDLAARAERMLGSRAWLHR
jgi:hypothetical protein